MTLVCLSHTHIKKKGGDGEDRMGGIILFILLGISDLKSKLETLKDTALVLGSGCTELQAGPWCSFESERESRLPGPGFKRCSFPSLSYKVSFCC